jgi:group I intron endonuclease
MAYGVIYCLTNLVNGKFYIGQTTQIAARRFYQHVKDAKRKTGPIQAALRKYGEVGFSQQVLTEADSADELNALETLWILATNAHVRGIGYNCDTGGGNKRMNPETREKLRRAHTGKKLSPEHVQNISQANRGKKRTGRALENLRAGGRKQSERMTTEQRNARSLRFKGIPTGRSPWNKGKTGVQVAWNKGVPQTEEHQERLRALRLGTTMSEEAKAKISGSLKGRMPAVNLMGREPWNKGAKGLQIAWNKGLKMQAA